MTGPYFDSFVIPNSLKNQIIIDLNFTVGQKNLHENELSLTKEKYKIAD